MLRQLYYRCLLDLGDCLTSLRLNLFASELMYKSSFKSIILHYFPYRNFKSVSIFYRLPSSSSSKDSYKSITSIIAAYSTYRTCIPTTRFEITSIAFDQQSSTHGKLFVDLYQYPYVRVVSYLLNDWRPKLEMHVHFWLVRHDDGSSVGEGEDDENEGNSERRGGERRDSSRKPMGKWMIAKQEDTIQPFSAILAVPLFIPLAWFISVVNVIAAWCVMGVGMLFGLWRATGSRRAGTSRTGGARTRAALFRRRGERSTARGFGWWRRRCRS